MYFFIKTNNPRLSFHLDMTPDERAIMIKHVAYWTEKATAGIAIVFGPVMGPKGVYGIAVCNVKDESEMKSLINNDPANGLLQYEILTMDPRTVVTPSIDKPN